MTRIITLLRKFDSNLWGYHFPVPEEVARQFIVGHNRRVLCTINSIKTIQCALMPSPEGYFLLINKQLVQKLGLVPDADVVLDIEKDESEFGHEVPESFSALLDQDDEGRAYFYKLTPGKQRTLIYVVGKVKNPDGQMGKGLAILQHLKEAQGVLDFKRLNVLIKEYNARFKLKS